jgi:hypothetical protein
MALNKSWTQGPGVWKAGDEILTLEDVTPARSYRIKTQPGESHSRQAPHSRDQVHKHLRV